MATETGPGAFSGDAPQLLQVSRDLLPRLWPEAERLLLEHREGWTDFYDLESLQVALAVGKIQLWLVNDAEEFFCVVLTECAAFPNRREVRIAWMGGKRLREVLPLIDAIHLWAKRIGATHVVVTGPRAWRRLLKDYGYFETAVVLERELGNLTEH